MSQLATETMVFQGSEAELDEIRKWMADPEKEEQWKASTKAKIEEQLQEMVNKAKEEKANQLDSLPANSPERAQIEMKYRQEMDQLRALAKEHYAAEVQREREERMQSIINLPPLLLLQQKQIYDEIKKDQREKEVRVRKNSASTNVSQVADDVGSTPPDEPGRLVREHLQHRDNERPFNLPNGSRSSPGSQRVGGLSALFAARQDQTPSPVVADVQHAGLSRRSSSTSLSRGRPNQIWKPSQSPDDPSVPTSRTLAHATGMTESPYTPSRRDSVTSNCKRGPSRSGSMRIVSGDIEPESPPSARRERVRRDDMEGHWGPNGRTRERQMSANAILTSRVDDRSHTVPSPGYALPYQPYSPYPDSPYAAPLSTSNGDYFPSTEDQTGMSVRSSSRAPSAHKGSPETARWRPSNLSATRPTSTTSFDTDSRQLPFNSGARVPYSPQSYQSVAPISASRPIVNKRSATFDDAPWHPQGSPNGYVWPGSDSLPRIARRNSGGSRSLRSSSSKQSLRYRPEQDMFSRQQLQPYDEQSVDDSSDDNLSDWEAGEFGLENLERRAEELKLVADAMRKADEAKKLAEEAKKMEEEAKRMEEVAKRMEEEARRIEEEARKKEEELKRKEQETMRREEDIRVQAEFLRQQADLSQQQLNLAKDQAQEAKRKEAEAKKKEAEARRKEEYVRQKEEEVRRQAEAARNKVEQAKRMEEQAKRQAEENQRKEEELRRKQDELRRREEDLSRREEEARKAQQEALKRLEELKRQQEASLKARQEELQRLEEAGRREEAARFKAQQEDSRRREEQARRDQEAQIKAQEEELRRNEEARREEEAKRRALQEEEQRREEERTKYQEEAKREAEQREENRREEKRKREETRRKAKQEEARRKARQEEARRPEEDRQRDEAKRKQEEDEARRIEEERQREEARRKEEEMQRTEVIRQLREMSAAEGFGVEHLDDDQLLASQQDIMSKIEQQRLYQSQERARTTASSAAMNIPGRSGSTSSSASADRTSSGSSFSSASGFASTARSSTSTYTQTSSAYAQSTWSTPSSASAHSKTPSTPTPTYSRASTATPTTPATPTSATGAKSAASGWRSTGSTSSGKFQRAKTSTSSTGPPRTEEERQRWQEEYWREQQEKLEREQQQQQYKAATKQLSKEEVVRIFEDHERRWSEITSRAAAKEPLTWEMFPWPMFKMPDEPEDITAPAVEAYVLSPHSLADKTKSTKDLIKEQIRRWHSDRFDTKFLLVVIEDEHDKVKEGAGVTTRALNELLRRHGEKKDLFA